MTRARRWPTRWWRKLLIALFVPARRPPARLGTVAARSVLEAKLHETATAQRRAAAFVEFLDRLDPRSWRPRFERAARRGKAALRRQGAVLGSVHELLSERPDREREEGDAAARAATG